MDIKCPNCGTEYEVEQNDMYQHTQCEVCGKDFVIGASAGTAAPAGTNASKPEHARGRFSFKKESNAATRASRVAMPSRFELPQDASRGATLPKGPRSRRQKMLIASGVVLGSVVVAGIIAWC